MYVSYRGRPCDICPKIINQKRPDGTLFGLIDGHLSCKVRFAHKIQIAKYVQNSSRIVYFKNPQGLDPPCAKFTPLNSFVRKS